MFFRRNPSHHRIMLSIHISRLLLHLHLRVRLPPPPYPPMMTISHRANNPRIQITQKIQKSAPRWLDDRTIEAPVPSLDIPFDQDNLGLGVELYEFFGEGDSGRVRGYSAEAAEEGVPFPQRESRAFVEEFGVQGRVPRLAVFDVGEELDRVVTGKAEDVQRGLHGLEDKLYEIFSLKM